jgi:PAS domain S-box-containing protein/putative nucleotidyltransferase with HDIG domain
MGLWRPSPLPALTRRLRLGDRRRLRLGDRGTASLAASLFALALLLRLLDHRVNDGETLLFMVPVGLLAIRFGLKGGIVGALAAILLTVVWDLAREGVGLTALGFITRGAAYLTLGVVVGLFVVQRRRLEAELVRYFEQSLELLWTSDLSGRLVLMNPAWERALGSPAERMRGVALAELVHPHDRESVAKGLLELVGGSREAVAMRSRFRAVGGAWVWLEWRARAALDEGTIRGVARDVTAQVQAEQQLTDQTRHLETMVAERTRDLNEARAETLQLLAVAAEYRDDETSQHTERVGELVAKVATVLGLSPESVTLLREAAPLHDIGKLAIPDRVLLKRGRLTATERTTMHAHTTLGARLLYGSHSPVLQLAGVIAESHHEWWDGNGYPNGLAGPEIPLVGRIVAVADVFDALTHDRPYKPAWPIEQALAMIRSSSGAQFDPQVVNAFVEVCSPPRPADEEKPLGGSSGGHDRVPEAL